MCAWRRRTCTLHTVLAGCIFDFLLHSLLHPQSMYEVLRSLCLYVFVYLFSVCLFARVPPKPHFQISPIFCTCCLWQWLGPPLTTLKYVTSSFVDDVMFSHNGANGPHSKMMRVFRPVRRVAATVRDVRLFWSSSPGGCTGSEVHRLVVPERKSL